jgi:hypothetical protein
MRSFPFTVAATSRLARLVRPLDEGGVGAASPDVAVLPGTGDGRRSMTFCERAGSPSFGCAGGAGVSAGGGAYACLVYAATMLADMRFSNMCTRSFILVWFRLSVASWYASMRASRRAAILSRPASASSRPVEGAVGPAAARAYASQEAWSAWFCASSSATYCSRASILVWAAFTLYKASAAYSPPLELSRNLSECSCCTCWMPSTAEYISWYCSFKFATRVWATSVQVVSTAVNRSFTAVREALR